MPKQVPSAEQCAYVSGILKNLSHPQRLLILCHLSEGPRSVNDLAELTGASQSAVSQFLSRMKAERLVSSERQTNYVYYDIANSQVKQIIQALYKIFNE